jgi:hypothetical protein
MRFSRAAMCVIAWWLAGTAGNVRAAEIAAQPLTDFDEPQAPLDDAAWQTASPAVLVQRAPSPGAATDYPTRARFLVGHTHLYVRIDCVDALAGDAVAHSLVFDGDQSFDDHVTLVLDTFGKRRTAYEFNVNLAGARTDGLISPAAIQTNYDWNGDWRAAVTRDASGWSAFFAIDTRGLQFERAAATWGMNIARYVPRGQLTLQWSGISLDASVSDLSRAGTLGGVAAVSSSSGWDVAPYLLARESTRGAALQTGLDMRYALSPEMTVAATVNPDFAEAQVDAQQINLTPYALFKPEKRAFFLSGSNQFTFASGIVSIFLPFDSRTIGLVNGNPVRIDEGVKVVGQSGPWSIGALGVRSGASVVSDPANLFVGRVGYDVDEHLRIGALATQGDPSGKTHNRFEGVDGIWRTANLFGDKNLNVSAWAAHSGGDALPGDRTGFGTYIDYPNDLWRWVISANRFGDALDPAMGFLPRPGTYQYDFYLGHFPRPTGESWVHQFFYEAELEQTEDLHGATESRKLTLTPFNVLTESSAHLEVHAALHEERLMQPFAIADGVTLPVGDYRFDRVHFQAESPTAGAFQVGAQLELGDFYDGTLTQLIPYVRWTTLDNRWRFEFNNETDRASLPQGRFIQRLHQFKTSYAFDSDLAFSSFTQYDSASGHIGVNAQLSWILTAGRAVFLVVNHAVTPPLTESPAQRSTLDNSLTFKVQWDFHL